MSEIDRDGLTWVKSSRSSGNGQCVEVARLAHGGRAVRDSKDPTGPILIFTHAEWLAFVEGAKMCEFDE